MALHPLKPMSSLGTPNTAVKVAKQVVGRLSARIQYLDRRLAQAPLGLTAKNRMQLFFSNFNCCSHRADFTLNSTWMLRFFF